MKFLPNLVLRSLVDEAEGEFWQSKKIYFSWLAAPLKIYALFPSKRICVKCNKFGAVREICNI